MLDQIFTTRTTYSAPIPPPVTLCAWVRNPDTNQKANKPAYIRCEIINADRAHNEIVVNQFGQVNYFITTFEDIRLVHTVNEAGETVKVLGNPPC